MADPFLGEIKMLGFNFEIRGWAFCNGQLLSISQNTALFALLGTIYGGNGQTTFALPNLQGRLPMHFGNGAGLTPRTIGEAGGQENVTLTAAQLPAHTHPFTGTGTPPCQSGPGGFDSPATRVPAISANTENYAAAPGNAVMAPMTVSGTTGAPTGGGQPAPNMPPFLCLNFQIALQGIFPSRV
jgi:microcystin-dependent protein